VLGSTERIARWTVFATFAGLPDRTRTMIGNVELPEVQARPEPYNRRPAAAARPIDILYESRIFVQNVDRKPP
jgi:hypothetical protein